MHGIGRAGQQGQTSVQNRPAKLLILRDYDYCRQNSIRCINMHSLQYQLFKIFC